MTHPPGWYPSPHYPDSVQYWDGADWTTQVQPMVRPVKNNRRTGVRVFSGFFLFVGIVMLSLTTPSVVDHFAPSTSQVVTTGEVTDVDFQTMKRNSGPGKVEKCRSTAEFTVNGTRHEAVSQYYEYPCEWKVGDSVDVTYDSAHPETAAVVGEISKSMTAAWFFFWAGSAISLVGALVLGASFLRGRRKR